MQQGLLEMPLFCLPKPIFFFQSGWDNAAPEAKRKAGVKLGNTGCRYCHRGACWGQVVYGGYAEEPMEGKGPLYRVHISHGLTPKQLGFCLAKLFLSP